MRDRMSRPRWSVPSQWVEDGVGCASAAISLALGGYGAIAGANAAARIQQSPSPVPIRAGFDSVTGCRPRAHACANPRGRRLEAAGRRSAAVGCMLPVSGPDTRVEQHVRKIAEDLGEDRDTHGDEGPGL